MFLKVHSLYQGSIEKYEVMTNGILESESSPPLNIVIKEKKNFGNIRLEDLKDILKLAIRAPSGDNSQPWKFIWNNQFLQIKNDSTRGRCFFNINEYASFLSCGALIENIRIAASSFSFSIEIKLKEGNEEIADLKFYKSNIKVDPLVAAVSIRQTNRFPFKTDAVPDDFLSQLTTEIPVSSPTKCNFYQSPNDIKLISKLASVADSTFWASKEIHDDVFKWIRLNLKARDVHEGLSLDVLGLDPFSKVVFPFLIKQKILQTLALFRINKVLGWKSSLNLRKSGAICIINLDTLSKANIMQAGMDIQRLWCRANLLGLAVQPMTSWLYLLMNKHVNGAPLLTPRFKKELDILEDLWQELSKNSKDIPVMCLRIGFPTRQAPFSERLDIKDVLEIKA